MSDNIYYSKNPALINVNDNNYAKILLIYELKPENDRNDRFDCLLVRIPYAPLNL